MSTGTTQAGKTQKSYPAKISNFLDGAYVQCACGLREARLPQGKAMQLAYAHNTGDHTVTRADLS